MKLFLAGVATETNTFSPLPTGHAEFSTCRRGEASGAPELAPVLRAASDWCARHGHQLLPGLLAFAQPAGPTVRAAWESLRDELLRDLRHDRDDGGVDAVFLFLHGAMVAEGYDDCEADLTARVREIVGPDVPIGIELDLHCHLDERLLREADIVVTYKEYPHIDVSERAIEVLELLEATRRKRIRPTMALYDCRMVGLWSTFSEPMKSFVAEMKARERQPGVLSVSLAHGFPYGDVAHAGAKMLAITDGDACRAADLSSFLGEQFRALREDIANRALPLEQALRHAVQSAKRPVVVADQSDNAGGGAPGDSTFALEWLLRNGVRRVGIAILHDPEVVKIVQAAGEGARLPLRLGGKTGVTSGMPVDVIATVGAIRKDYMHEFPQGAGIPLPVPVGDAVALDCDGVHVIVGSRRSQCFSPKIFRDFGVPNLDIYIPKSTAHFQAGFGPMAGEIIFMGAPGALTPILTQIPYRHMSTADKYPWTE